MDPSPSSDPWDLWKSRRCGNAATGLIGADGNGFAEAVGIPRGDAFGLVLWAVDVAAVVRALAQMLDATKIVSTQVVERFLRGVVA